MGNRSRLHPLGGQGGKRKNEISDELLRSDIVSGGGGKRKTEVGSFVIPPDITSDIWERKGRGGAKGKYRGNRRRRFLSPALFGFFRDRLRDFFFKNLFTENRH